MNREEIIDRLREMIKQKRILAKASNIENKHKKDYDALVCALETLEKQIPKKPCEGVFCPTCGGVNIWDSYTNRLNYCGDCGQKVDWSDNGDS